MTEGALKCPACPIAFGVPAVSFAAYGTVVLGVNLFELLPWR